MYFFFQHLVRISSLILCVNLAVSRPPTLTCTDPDQETLKEKLMDYIRNYRESTSATSVVPNLIFVDYPQSILASSYECQDLPDFTKDNVVFRSTCPGVYKVSLNNINNRTSNAQFLRGGGGQ